MTPAPYPPVSRRQSRVFVRSILDPAPVIGPMTRGCLGEEQLVKRSQPRRRATRCAPARSFRTRLPMELLEDRTLFSQGQWTAVFAGMVPGETLEEQTQYGTNLLHSSGLVDQDVRILGALD